MGTRGLETDTGGPLTDLVSVDGASRKFVPRCALSCHARPTIGRDGGFEGAHIPQFEGPHIRN